MENIVHATWPNNKEEGYFDKKMELSNIDMSDIFAVQIFYENGNTHISYLSNYDFDMMYQNFCPSEHTLTKWGQKYENEVQAFNKLKSGESMIFDDCIWIKH